MIKTIATREFGWFYTSRNKIENSASYSNVTVVTQLYISPSNLIVKHGERTTTLSRGRFHIYVFVGQVSFVVSIMHQASLKSTVEHVWENWHGWWALVSDTIYTHKKDSIWLLLSLITMLISVKPTHLLKPICNSVIKGIYGLRDNDCERTEQLLLDYIFAHKESIWTYMMIFLL